MSICEKAHGPEHTRIATTLISLAELYRVQGRYEEAEPLYERALVIQEKILGLEHSDLVSLVEIYADLLRNLGRTAKADGLEAQAKAIRAKHPLDN